jgi:hypothetical protein
MIKKDILIFFAIFLNDNIVIPYWDKIIGILIVTFIGYRFTFARDRINRNKNAVAVFSQVMAEEREKLVKKSVMDIQRQENAYVALKARLFIIQRIRIRRNWNQYIEAEGKQKEYVQYFFIIIKPKSLIV